MNKSLVSLALGLGLAVPIQSQAACPTLTSVGLSYYLCPIVGASNPLPQGFTAMVYSRPADFSIGGICSNIRGAAAKYFGKQKDYEGVETDIKNGKLVCVYDLPSAWKSKAHIEDFALEANVENPAKLPATACMPLNFSQLTSMMCHTNYRIGDGPEWTIKTKGVGENICSLGKGLFASIGASPEGVISGQIKEDEFRPFSHTCSYKYHTSERDERSLVLNGSLSLPILKAVNTHAAGEVKK